MAPEPSSDMADLLLAEQARSDIETGLDYRLSEGSGSDAPPEGGPDIPGEREVGWQAARIRELTRQIERYEARAEQEKELIERWLLKVTKGLEREIAWRRTGLEVWMRGVNANDPKFKTCKTPWGDLKLRAVAPTWNANDEELLDWVKEHYPQFIRQEVARGEFRKATKLDGGVVLMKDTGEVVDCAVVSPEETPRFSISLEGGENGD